MKKPIWAAYADTGALEVTCPHCAAEPRKWCTRDDGRVRRVPCVERATSTAIVSVAREDRYRDFSEPTHPREDSDE